MPSKKEERKKRERKTIEVSFGKALVAHCCCPELRDLNVGCALSEDMLSETLVLTFINKNNRRSEVTIAGKYDF